MPAELSRLEISPVKSSKVQNAFTLVELLVVISIIGLLAGLLVPAIQGGLAAARKAESASQLKQLGTLAVAYLLHHAAFFGRTATTTGDQQ